MGCPWEPAHPGGRNLPGRQQGQRAEETQSPDSGTCHPRGPVSRHSRTACLCLVAGAPAQRTDGLRCTRQPLHPARVLSPWRGAGRALGIQDSTTALLTKARPGKTLVQGHQPGVGLLHLPALRWVGREPCPLAPKRQATVQCAPGAPCPHLARGPGHMGRRPLGRAAGQRALPQRLCGRHLRDGSASGPHKGEEWASCLHGRCAQTGWLPTTGQAGVSTRPARWLQGTPTFANGALHPVVPA